MNSIGRASMSVWFLLGACAPGRPGEPAASAAVSNPLPQPSAGAPPVARRVDVVDEYHGVKVPDPYRWLEDMASDETREWVAAQNRLSEAYFARIEGTERLSARLATLMAEERFSVPVRRGPRTFWNYSDGRHAQPQLRAAASPDEPGRTLLDPDSIATDGSLGYVGFVASDDGEQVAYGLSIAGGDWEEWRVRSVASGAELSDRLPSIKYYPPVFAPGSRGLYYSRFPTPPPGRELTQPDRGCAVYFHRLGTPSSEDRLVHARPDQPTWQFWPSVTPDGRYLVLTIGDGQVGDRSEEQIAYLELDAEGRTQGTRVVPLIDRFGAEFVFLGNEGPVFYLMTDLEAPQRRVVAIDTRTPARERWREVIAEGPDPITAARLVGHQLIITRLHDVHAAVSAHDLSGKLLREVSLPGLGTVRGFEGEPGAEETYYTFSSFTQPRTVYRYRLSSGESRVWKAPPPALPPSDYSTRQVFYPSRDGTRVPMFVVSRRDVKLDGNNPTLLRGYGVGGFVQTPSYNPALVAWLERGGVYALANIRGGGEYGRAWQEAARREKRQVSFDDFIAAAEWLINERYTSPSRLGISGASAGGLLVAAVALQRPELFRAVVPIVGVFDMLRFPLFGQGAGWQGDMGSPSVEREFRALLAFSPVHNTRAGTRYPAALVLTGDHDVRVAPLHSYKFVAALQAAQAGDAPILLHVDTASGHQGGSTLQQTIGAEARLYAFLARQLGLTL
jgi:prolyl oligopeptidase